MNRTNASPRCSGEISIGTAHERPRSVTAVEGTTTADPQSPNPAHQRAGDTTTLARRGVLSFVGGVAFGVFNFLWIVVVTQGWGSQRAGELFEGVAVFTIAVSIVIFGAEVGLVRGFAGAAATDRHHELRHMLLVATAPVLAVSLLVAALAPVLAMPAAELFVSGERGVDAVADYIRTFGYFVPFATMFYTLLAATRGLGKMSPTVFLEKFARGGMQAAFAFIVVIAGAGATAMAVGYGLPFAIGAVLAAGWLYANLRTVERNAKTERAITGSFTAIGGSSGGSPRHAASRRSSKRARCGSTRSWSVACSRRPRPACTRPAAGCCWWVRSSCWR